MTRQSQGRVVLKLTIILMLRVLANAGANRQPIPPLSTSSRWVVDRFGVRVKLACVNWAGHLLSLREVHRRVVSILTAFELMVILDNHVSKPQLCCRDNDGNGFWGDKYFDADEWLQGLTTVASEFSYNPFVVAMSLRNELRGPRQNEADWRVLMSQAAELVHDVNPDVLIIAGGLSYATDLNFLSSNRGLDTEQFPGKLVYEFHWYRWNRLTKGSDFNNASDSEACSNSQHNVHIDNGFLVDQGVPLLLVGSTWRAWRNPRVTARLQVGIQNST